MPPLRPKARQEGLLVQEVPDEVLVYDTASHKAHCLNRTAAVVWRRATARRRSRKRAPVEVTWGPGRARDVVWHAPIRRAVTFSPTPRCRDPEAGATAASDGEMVRS